MCGTDVVGGDCVKEVSTTLVGVTCSLSGGDDSGRGGGDSVRGGI